MPNDRGAPTPNGLGATKPNDRAAEPRV